MKRFGSFGFARVVIAAALDLLVAWAIVSGELFLLQPARPEDRMIFGDLTDAEVAAVKVFMVVMVALALAGIAALIVRMIGSVKPAAVAAAGAIATIIVTIGLFVMLLARIQMWVWTHVNPDCLLILGPDCSDVIED